MRDELGIAFSIVAEIEKLLAPLGDQFRRDLGMICESHHLNDLNDRKKYKTSEPYGDSDTRLSICSTALFFCGLPISCTSQWIVRPQ